MYALTAVNVLCAILIACELGLVTCETNGTIRKANRSILVLHIVAHIVIHILVHTALVIIIILMSE